MVAVCEDCFGLSGNLRPRTAATITRLAEHFVHLLGQVAADASTPVGALRLLDADERHRLLVEWNRTARPRTQPADVVSRIGAQARQRTDSLAVAGEDERLDYATLERRANRLAHPLIARGVRPDQVVGLRAGRSAGLIVAILGVLKTGAAYLPLDPALPPERLAGMVADAAPALVLGDDDLAAVEAEGRHDDPPGVVVHPANLAYVIYTSGSTGRPKGVAVARGGVVNLLADWVSRVGAAPGEPAALWSSVGFDVSVQEIFLPLTTSGALHLVPEKLRGVAFGPAIAGTVALPTAWPPSRAVPRRIVFSWPRKREHRGGEHRRAGPSASSGLVFAAATGIGSRPDRCP
ncbi:AMP-binding protein [Micromonospora haikouensis]|uniref:AMP-binding protein n=1 Tax=Micromonospora haikouensis TaxID=686309 RepID=UPI0036837855